MERITQAQFRQIDRTLNKADKINPEKTQLKAKTAVGSAVLTGGLVAADKFSKRNPEKLQAGAEKIANGHKSIKTSLAKVPNYIQGKIKSLANAKHMPEKIGEKLNKTDLPKFVKNTGEKVGKFLKNHKVINNIADFGKKFASKPIDFVLGLSKKHKIIGGIGAGLIAVHHAVRSSQINGEQKAMKEIAQSRTV